MQPQHKNVNSAFQSLIDLKHRSIKIDTIAHKIETERKKKINMKQHTPVRMVISSGHSARFSSLFYPPTLSYSDYKPFITHCIIFIRCPLCDSYQMNDEVFLLFMHQQPAQSLPLTHRPFLMNASCVVFPLVLVVCVCVRAGCFFFWCYSRRQP